jgi:hypothetical protein
MNIIRIVNQRDLPCRIEVAAKEKTGQTIDQAEEDQSQELK